MCPAVPAPVVTYVVSHTNADSFLSQLRTGALAGFRPAVGTRFVRGPTFPAASMTWQTVIGFAVSVRLRDC